MALAVICAIGLMGLSAWRQGWFTPTEHVFVVLDNGAQGVQVGTLVKLKGFKIGEVDEVTLESNLDVNVSMRVATEKLALLGADAQVKLSRDTPIGAKYIEFMPGTKPKGTLMPRASVALHTGGDVEDIMLIVKSGVEKLTSALGKIEPILDDTKKLTGEAADMRETIHGSVDVMLGNLQALSGQLKQIGQTAQGMASHVDADRAVIMAQIKDIVKTLDTTITKEVPPTLRSTRIATEDVAEITDGAKKTWPISGFVASDPPIKPLPLDAFEAKR